MEWARKHLGKLFTAAAISLAALSWSPGEAQALERGQCASPQALSAELREEGEGNPFAFVATMESIAVDDEGETAPLAQFIAANQDRSRFYILTGDVPLGEQAGEFCVTGVGHTLEINDYRQDRPPRLVNQFTFNDEEARQQCDAIIENVGNLICDSRGTMLERANELYNQRLALQGILQSITGEDSGLYTVVATVDGEERYATLTSADKGATTVLESGTSFSFTPPTIAMLEEMESEDNLAFRSSSPRLVPTAN